MSASYQKSESGITHQTIMPNVARPEALTSFSDLFAEFAAKFNIQPRGIFCTRWAIYILSGRALRPFSS